MSLFELVGETKSGYWVGQYYAEDSLLMKQLGSIERREGFR